MYVQNELKHGIKIFRFEGRLCSEVDEYPGFYVTMDGEAYICPWTDKAGRYHEGVWTKNESLSREGIGITMHRLMALAFIHNPDPEHKTVVDHINRDHHDNRVENLRWVTIKENNRNTSQTERVWEREGEHSWWR